MAVSEMDYVNISGVSDIVGVEQQIGIITINGTTYTKYKQIIDCGTLPNATSKDITVNINCVGVISLYGASMNTSKNVIPLIWFASSANNAFLQLLGGTTLRITSNTDLSAYTKTLVTVEYYR